MEEFPYSPFPTNLDIFKVLPSHNSEKNMVYHLQRIVVKCRSPHICIVCDLYMTYRTTNKTISFVFVSLIVNDFKSSHPLTKKPYRNIFL